MPGAPCFTDGTEAGLLRSMAEAGIGAAVTVPVATKASQVPTINALAAAGADPRLIRFGALHPQGEDLKGQVDFLRSHGIPGIKLHPEYQDFHVDDPACFRMYELLQAAGLIVVFHAGWDPGPFTRDHSRPEALRRVADRFPGLRMVAAHMGGYRMWDEVERHLAGAPVWFDTSAACEALSGEDLARLARRHGVERVLFASDSPWFSQAEALRRIEAAPFTEAERERILWRNAEELLGKGKGMERG